VYGHVKHIYKISTVYKRVHGLGTKSYIQIVLGMRNHYIENIAL